MATQIRESMKAFFPDANPKWIKKLTHASLAYYGTSFLNLIFSLPLTGYRPYMKLFEFENIELLDAAYAQAQEEGTGVILTVAHTADFVHYLPCFGQHPHGYKTLVIGNLSNSPLYQYLLARPGFKNMVFYPSIKFSIIGPLLEKGLREGRMLIHYSDYSQLNHLRIPMWQGEYPYLIRTLQSGVRLHRKTRAIIVPCFAYPDRTMGKVMMKIVDNRDIMAISNKYWDAPEREFHGRMSMAINKVMYRYIRPIAHCWEEAMNFAGMRLEDSLHIPVNTSVRMLVVSVHDKLIQILENSWEPDRPDAHWLTLIDQKISIILSVLQFPDKIALKRPAVINLSKMDGISELRKICRVVSHRLRLVGEEVAAIKFSELGLTFIFERRDI